MHKQVTEMESLKQRHLGTFLLLIDPLADGLAQQV